jgi:hypothetical protein
MEGLLRVDCPHCSESTLVLVPAGTECVGVAGLQSPWPLEAETAVRGRCPSGDGGFLVFLKNTQDCEAK